MENETRSADDLAPDPVNPREIGDDQRAGLGASLEIFGDLSGIVWNKRNGLLVAGHQRMERLRAAGAESWTQVSRVFAMELSPRWCDAAVARREAFTGQIAYREGATK
jgi:ParB-like chromosome segregation protein Spo0J